MPTPTSALANAMATAYHAGEMEHVIALAAQAPQTGDADESAMLWLGLAQQATHRYGPATATFHRLSQLRPEVSAYWNNLALACRHAGDTAASEQAFLKAQSLAPEDAEVLYNLGLLYLQQRRWLPARQTLMDAVALEPHFIEARLQAAHACYVCGDNGSQEAMLAGAIDWPPQPAEQALVLAAMLAVQGDLDAALRTLAHAQLPPGPDSGVMLLRIAAQRIALHERSNQVELARDELLELPLGTLDRLPPEAQSARAEGWSAHAALAMRGADHGGAAALYQRVLAVAPDDQSRAGAAFGLASACDKQGRQHEAWQALQTAHAAQLDIARNVLPELLAPDSQPLQMADRVVGRAAHEAWHPLSSPSAGQSPVFVVGFPRSGTTLLEQMLDAHPDFQSMDERAFIHELIEGMELFGQHYPADLANLTQTEADQLRAVYFRRVDRALPDRGRRRLVDKNPLNMLCLPMIMRLFPQARIILCLRHPCDVLLSCYMQPFRSPAFMVLCSSLQRLADGYVQAFGQWQKQVEVFAPQLLEWRYESVVSRFEASVAGLGEFLGIEDASPMARFSEHARSKSFISTPSYAQVTQGINGNAVGRWHAYREWFEPVLPTLRPVMKQLGYAD
ncbi:MULTISPECIES: tetratricopeptide repeat-containing sulfotransferase family protein [Rhodanobacter]|uniref:tetratricopeptide repeat-containing sulfotransferase family protein n=1 Tax=Rhodanobacter TaxID=75309 RepID=UPI00042A671B|nr:MULTISPECIES: sulfotransferase family protein [Rhodanobacter]TAN17022.1 MAG: tetratricopeptide repeat protein [Rhodanobacter sp.]UJJ54760.1 sulfotransferase [Rhodanobacter thiooxydans]